MTCGDLSAIELCVEDWKQKQQFQGQVTEVVADGGKREVKDDDSGREKASDSVETPSGLELNSSAYKPDADPSSSQANNNMAVAFELNL